MSKTAEEILSVYECDFDCGKMITSNDAFKAMEEYASQFYTRTEVLTLLKQALEDAAKEATVTYEEDWFDTRRYRVNKRSITGIDLTKYLTK